MPSDAGKNAGWRRGTALHVVLLAGGSGTRFWPLSRAARPKQVLALAGGEPLLVATWKRVRALAPPERRWVIAPRALRRSIRTLLPELRRDRLVLEPTPRDTGPAIALGCAAVAERDPDAVMAVFPTDHAVRSAAAFRRAVRTAALAAEAEPTVVCLGVPPDRPATGFGWIECAEVPREGDALPVRRFVEKPDAGTAVRLLRSGRHLWNAGIFAGRVDVFLEAYRGAAPGVLRAVQGHRKGRPGSWDRAPRGSVDRQVLERGVPLRVVLLDAGWDDLGSWAAVAGRGERDAPARREVLLLDSAGSCSFGEGRGRFTAIVGVPEVVVVDTPDALLVLAKGSSEGMRQVVERVRALGRGDLL